MCLPSTKLIGARNTRSKIAFEKLADSHGVRVKHCHADNGRFADDLWVKDCMKQKQGLTFAGVNAHFQNGLAEKRIRDLQDVTRTQNLEASAKWPILTTNLWPYCLRQANNVMNNTYNKQSHGVPLEIFSDTDVQANLKNFHPVGCPVYVLDNSLQAGKHVHKWKS